MRWRAAVVAALLVAVLVAGCGGGGGTSTTSSTRGAAGDENDATTTTTAAAAKRPKRTAPTPATGSFRGPVPILMYHVITAPKPDTPLPALWVPWKTFAATMYALKEAGYTGVTLDAVWKAWHGGPGLPAKPVVVSFDDGYLSHSQHARPTLRALGWPGVLYLEGKNIDPDVGLSQRQIRGLIKNGWEIDAHTLTHPDLTTVGPDQLREEVAGSRKKIQDLFGVPVNSFAYPAGKNDAAARAAVRDAGFDTAVTVEPGIATKDDDPYALPRVRVNGGDSPQAVVDRIAQLRG